MTVKTKIASLALVTALAVGALTPMAATAKADGLRNNGYGGYASSQRYRSPRINRGRTYSRYAGRRDHRRNGFGVLRRLRHVYRDKLHAYKDMRRGYSARPHANSYRFNGYKGQRRGYNYRRH